MTAADADLERRFAGLRRLYGDSAYARIRSARIAVVGVGGVGSWTVEALARSGVAGLVLVDLDHIAESNVNRQVHAITPTIGQAKVQALRERIEAIHPGCEVTRIEEFVDERNWLTLLESSGAQRLDALVDACDQVRAKAVLAGWALQTQTPFATVGAAGGKRTPQRVETGDLAQVTHDPLLAALRQRLRRHHGAARGGAMGIACVYSREPVTLPEGEACDMDSGLNCHGYGSAVTVTATFGLVAASLALQAIASRNM